MFTQTIASTVFTGPGANAVFKNITGDMILRDGTFLSTLRALVGPRIGEDSLLMHNEGLVNPLNGEALMRSRSVKEMPSESSASRKSLARKQAVSPL